VGEHIPGCRCGTCDAMKARVRTTTDWRAKHAAHLQAGFDFARQDFPHPSGTWLWLCCPCGDRHLTTKDRADG